MLWIIGVIAAVGAVLWMALDGRYGEQPR